MAVTFTKTDEFPVGANRAVYGTVTLGGQDSGAVGTTLEVIYGGSVCCASCTSGGFKAIFNKDSAGAAANGYLQIKSGTTGDDFNVFLFGR